MTRKERLFIWFSAIPLLLSFAWVALLIGSWIGKEFSKAPQPERVRKFPIYWALISASKATPFDIGAVAVPGIT